LIGGFIASFANWRWVFGATAGLAILVTAAGIVYIPPPPPALAAKKDGVSLLRSVDWIGGVLVTLGLLAFMFALTEGNVVGWGTVWIYMLLVIALLLIALFVAWQWYQEKHTSRPPLMKISIFRNGRFTAAMFIMAIFFAAFNDFLIYATYFFQDFQALSALDTTLRFIPTGIGGVIIAFIMSHLISRLSTWRLLAFGNFSVSLSCLLYAIPIPADTSYFAIGLPAMLFGVIGADITWPCLTLFTSKTLPKEDQVSLSSPLAFSFQATLVKAYIPCLNRHTLSSSLHQRSLKSPSGDLDSIHQCVSILTCT
jgi:predicted MFS family arabinose efflux permease